jgi:hypothetical protein
VAERNWRFTNDLGRAYLIGLFHGDSTGHVVVHCNNQVMLVDFNVFESAHYSFFVDDELCELDISRAGQDYYYNCHINHEADTPKNRWRQERIAQMEFKNKTAWAVFGGLMVLAIGAVIWLRR